MNGDSQENEGARREREREGRGGSGTRDDEREEKRNGAVMRMGKPGNIAWCDLSMLLSVCSFVCLSWWVSFLCGIYALYSWVGH